MNENNQSLLEFVEITKDFPGVRALDSISFDIQPGEVHALLGENGAGKTTMINLMSGALTPDHGKIILRGQEVKIHDPQTAYKLGISVVSQEFKLCNNLTVAGNIFLGREIRNRQNLLDWKAMNQEAKQLLTQLGLPLDPKTPVKDLRVSQQQMSEIAKALSWKSNIIIMDEPTSALSRSETDFLFQIIRTLKSQGVTVIYVSHRLEEIFEIADRITVLRDGHHIKTLPVHETNIQQVIAMMIGRDMANISVLGEAKDKGPQFLSVKNLTKAGNFTDVSFEVNCGELVSIFGLQGSGKGELARSIFGVDRFDRGQVMIEGKPVSIKSPRDAIRYGMGYAPSDRRNEGLVLGLDIKSNIAITNLDEFSKFGFINTKKVLRKSAEMREKLDIVSSNLNQQVSKLSGGNQQKVIVARLLAAKPALLIFDEPTRGIDIGAKVEIYKLLRSLVEKGLGVLVISSELPEVKHISDRILVMFNGRINGEFNRGNGSSEQIMACATGTTNHSKEMASKDMASASM